MKSNNYLKEKSIFIVFLFIVVCMVLVSMYSFYSTCSSAMEVSAYAGKCMVEETAARAELKMEKHESVMDNLIYQVKELMDLGHGNNEIKQYFDDFTEYLHNNVDDYYSNIYAYIDGAYIEGSDNYDYGYDFKKEMKWYEKVINSDNGYNYSTVYFDEKSDMLIMRYAKVINKELDAIAFDVRIDNVSNLVENTDLYTDMCQIIYDDSGSILAKEFVCDKPDKCIVVQELDRNATEIFNVIKNSVDGYESKTVFTDFKEQKFVLYYTEVNSQWYSAVVIPYKTVFQNTLNTIKGEILIMVSLLSALVLAVFIVLHQQRRSYINRKTVDCLIGQQNTLQVQFSNLIKSSYDRIYEVNTDSKEVFEYETKNSKMIKKMIPYDIDDMYKNVIAHCHFDDLGILNSIYSKESILKNYREKRLNSRIKTRRLMQDGSYHWWLSESHIYMTENNEISIMVYMKDIEDEEQKIIQNRKNLQDALVAANIANDAKSGFLSRMSHDMRTPMNAIIGMTSIAEAHIEEKPRVEDCLKKINISSKHLLKLINQVLDMSKIESGKIELNDEEFSLDELLQTTLEIVNNSVEEKEHILTVDMSSVVHNHVIGDTFRIQQVLVNILNNAIKYTHIKGRITLKIWENEMDLDGIGMYSIMVEDNGRGMKKEFLDHIFEPFSMQEDSRLTGVEGTGLGMAITNNVVHMMNGDIFVESKEGIGSKFIVKLYLKLIDDNCTITKEEVYAEKEPQRTEKNCAEIDFTGKRILVVDDNELNLEVVKEIIADTGAEVECACDGKMAVEMFEASLPEYYDLIFMDIQMRTMNGYEATETIRKLTREDAGRVPIVAMTANAFTEDIERSRIAGMNDHISKPLDIKKLWKMLEKFL